MVWIKYWYSMDCLVKPPKDRCEASPRRKVTVSRGRLFCGGLVAILASMPSSRRIFILLLGALVALGMNLSVVQAGEMSAKMTMSPAMSASGNCHTCGDDGGMAHKKMDSCSFGCVTPAIAAVPQTTPAGFVQASLPVPLQDSLLLGRLSSPDPLPPRSSDLT
jgi:hypothetical protein